MKAACSKSSSLSPPPASTQHAFKHSIIIYNTVLMHVKLKKIWVESLIPLSYSLYKCDERLAALEYNKVSRVIIEKSLKRSPVASDLLHTTNEWMDLLLMVIIKCYHQNVCVCVCVCVCYSVSGWTGQPQSVCLFHKGDQILAINDLHTGSVDEFNMYLSKSLKNEVRSRRLCPW